jgi:cellulose synthase/poly-beta-1,6-N-acetylglucosamine synthase-like glycosyltransferase
MKGLDFIYIVLHILEFVVCFNLIWPILLYLFWKIKKNPSSTIIGGRQRSFGVIITAYQQTEPIPDVVDSILACNYSNFNIYVVADNCIPSEDLIFNNDCVKVLYPKKILASNTESHFYAINNFIRNHDVLLIMDSDNLAHPELIRELNLGFDQGFEAVQGIRIAKNLDTTIACLDAARDIYYHFYDGKILFELGSSATLSGSGMAFTVDLYKNCMEGPKIIGAGFDKILQARILASNKRIAFKSEAIVYDQKTSNSKQLISQRSRWIGTWFRYFKFGFSLLYQGFRNLSLNQILFGVVLLRPPLFMFLALAIVLIVVNLMINPFMALILSSSMLLFVIGFVVSLMTSHTDKKIYNSLLYIPVFIFYQLMSLVKSLLPDKNNIATKHDHRKK